MKLPFRTMCAAAALLTGLMFANAATAQEGERPIYLDAIEIEQNREGNVITARGEVSVQSGDRMLFADEVEYRTDEDRVIARGNVRLHDGDMPAQTAEEIELTNEWSEAMATGFAMLMDNNGRAASAYAVRRSDGGVTLHRAYYTACDLCEDSRRPPTWRFRAREVVQDPESEMIYYRDVRLEAFGVPIFYSPVFAHADPSAPRRSGFLIPTVDLSNRLGFVYQQPYYHVMSPHRDLVVTPMVMTEYNPVVRYEYRQRFWSGAIRVRGSATYEQEFDRDGGFGDSELRGHIAGSGAFNIAPGWVWRFNVQLTSDPLYMERYGLRGDADRDSDFARLNARLLPTEINVRGRTRQYFANATVMGFQSLADNIDDETLPIIAPIVEAEYRLPLPGWAGFANARASGIYLTRDVGNDYARATGEIDWSRNFTLPGGIRVSPYAGARGDAYRFTRTNASGVTLETREFTRTMANAGVDVSWPFLRPGDLGDTILAPRIQLASSTALGDDELAPGEDSLNLELDVSNLFARNRANGYDAWEEGTHLNAGLTASFQSKTRYLPDTELFVGRSFRLDGDASFGPGSGLDEEQSDWVAQLDVNFGNQFELGVRGRFDGDTTQANRIDAFSRVSIWRVRGDITYSLVDDAAVTTRVRESINLGGNFRVTDNWFLAYSAVRDLERGVTRKQDVSLIYRDECTDLRIIYDQTNYDIGNLGPSRSIMLQVTLFSIGNR
ncbi:LPS-assembly protein LptD [Glycocaulis alkaliphilus]|nr:LPS assembly protein LptD [Glycocaulis alkaliphilus]